MKGEARRTALAGGGLGLLLAAALLFPCFRAPLVPGRGDLAHFFWPMKSYTAARWAAGEIPLWNPLSGCGEPWLAQLQSGALYPGDLPFLLRWPAGPLAGIALHLAVAASGMAAWLWALGASRPGALAGAAVYAGGGAFLSLVPVYNNACTAAWLPWVFLGARRAVEERRVVALALPLALAFLAGEPALAAAGGIGAAWVAWVSRGEGAPATAARPARPALARLLGGGFLAAGIAAAALLPFAQHVVRSGRATGVDRAEAMSRAVGPGDLADLVLPPSEEATRTPGGGRGGYLLTLALGPGAFLLAAGAGGGFPGRGRFLAALAVVALVGLLLSLGERGLLGPLLHGAGVLRGLRFPARWFVFPHLLLAVLAGAGLDGWLHGEFSSRTARTARTAARAVLSAVSLLLVATLATGALAGGRDPYRGAAAVLSAALLAALLVAGRSGGSLRGKWRATAALLLLAAPLPFVARDPLAPVPAADLRPDVRTSLGLVPREGENRVFPLLADGDLLRRTVLDRSGRWDEGFPRRGALALAGYANLTDGIPSAASATPIPDVRRVRVLGAALAGGSPAAILSLANVRSVVTPFPVSIPGAQLARRSGEVLRYDLPAPSGRLFFPRSVRRASDEEVLAALRAPDFEPGETAYVAGAGQPLAAARSASAARITADLAERTEVLVESASEAFLVLTRSFDEGWSAEIDGRPLPLLRTDLAFTGFQVPPGSHRVVLRYLPVSLLMGGVLSAASVVAAFVLWLRERPAEVP